MAASGVPLEFAVAAGVGLGGEYLSARLAIEAGVAQGWDRYVGPRGATISLDRFGASAPGDIVLRELGFNVENVLKQARALLG